MNILKWIIREIIYFPKFVFMIILTIIFITFNYKKGINWIDKNL
jgi:hypothetical protein